jgi:chemotaxis protein methyltransferase CheR
LRETRKDTMIVQTPPARATLSNKQFVFLTQYLSAKYGLKIPEEKKVLLESRIASRMNQLKIQNVDDYIQYTFSPDKPNAEYVNFIAQVTTHKTFFFRERYQFDFLSRVLDNYMAPIGTNRLINIWSAGCSTGEEVYTIGMTLHEKRSHIPHLEYRILGTDISVPSLRQASTGFFSSELENLPEDYKRKYFQRTVIEGKEGLQFSNSEIKAKINLGVLNLNKPQYNLPVNFDFIFCRNVTIYFDGKTRSEVMERIVSKLRPGGFLFLGHSETALGMSLPLKSIKPTIYQKV